MLRQLRKLLSAVKRKIRPTVEQYFPSPNELFHRKLRCEVGSVIKNKGRVTLLDMGCGDHSPVSGLKRAFGRYLDATGVDLWLPSINKSLDSGAHDRYVHKDLLSFNAPARSYDIVLLQKAERIAKEKVIVYTPNGFLEQFKQDPNPYQKHRSGWHIPDFQQRGFNISGTGLRASLRRTWDAHKGRYRYLHCGRRPKVVFGFLTFLFAPIVFHHPTLAQSLFCVKVTAERCVDRV